MNKTTIVIPTYNEKENITKLIPQLFALNLEHLHILIVDDNSPDGTGKQVLEMSKQYPNLHLLHREKKEGLGPAYLAGFRWALEHGAERIMEMDADFSHNPKYVPQLIAASQDADLVLGSRYVPGGGVENWNLVRRMISRFGNVYARIILGLRVRDLTGGFKCYRRATLESLDLSSVSSLGYNFQIETTYKAIQNGAKIKEIPIIFTERQIGKSKFSIKIILESFFQVLVLRFKK